MPVLAARGKARYLAIFLVFISSIVFPLGSPTASNASDPSTSPANFAYPEFEATWARADAPVLNGQVSRSWLWGPAPGIVRNEPFAEASDGVRKVQYFDKARMELNDKPAAASPSDAWRVTTGLLVAEMVSGRVQMGANKFVTVPPARQLLAGDGSAAANPRYSDFASRQAKASNVVGQSVTGILPAGTNNVVPEPGILYAHFSPETSHNIPDVFWTFLNKSGPVRGSDGSLIEEKLIDWVYVMGYPITEAYWTPITVSGKSHTGLVQLFQRRTLTYLPDLAEGWQVQMGNVGLHYYEWRYGTAGGTTTLPVELPPLRPATGSFVGIEGSSFTYNGSEAKLKGTNYWLSDAPFGETWASWNGPKARTELAKAKELGVNTIRIGIPYDYKPTRDVVWGNFKVMEKVSPWIISQMTQVLQIADEYKMKVIFALFEWYDQQPKPGSSDEATNMVYLDGIIKPFAEDDRVLAWDLRNEPDFYPAWGEGSQSEVIDWLGRMALQVRTLDTRHPITVGIGNYKNLWHMATNGSTILGLVDFVAFHCYDAGALAGQIAEIEKRTTKPVLLEEMGWPTSPGRDPMPENALFDEATQNFLYTTMLDASKGADIAGAVQWTLWDYLPAVVHRKDYESYFGLVRRNGTFKPAASVFKDRYPAQSLSSDTHTNLPLDTSDNPNIR